MKPQKKSAQGLSSSQNVISNIRTNGMLMDKKPKDWVTHLWHTSDTPPSLHLNVISLVLWHLPLQMQI